MTRQTRRVKRKPASQISAILRIYNPRKVSIDKINEFDKTKITTRSGSTRAEPGLRVAFKCVSVSALAGGIEMFKY